MLVLSRETGRTILIDASHGAYLMTVTEVLPDRQAIQMSISGVPWDAIDHALAADLSLLDSRSRELSRNNYLDICHGVRVTLVDLRDGKARIGVVAPREVGVHRLEVYQTIVRENRLAQRHRPDDGMAGAPVERPPVPKPPTLNIGLNEPRSGDGSGS